MAVVVSYHSHSQQYQPEESSLALHFIASIKVITVNSREFKQTFVKLLIFTIKKHQFWPQMHAHYIRYMNPIILYLPLLERVYGEGGGEGDAPACVSV